MKKYIFSIIALIIFSGAFAQEIGNFMGQGPLVSPEITDNTITFRISAPYADEVLLSGFMGRANVVMTQNQNGVWSVSLPLPAPELYTYSFTVDGLSVADPTNIFMQRDGTRYLSAVIIPGELTENYFPADEHGNLNEVWYDSPTLGFERRLFVYTPYGYEESNDDYPVLYLLHGAGGDEDAWSSMGRACQILDNLIEKGLAEPMLCVMPNGNASQVAARTLMIDEIQPDTDAAGGGMMGDAYPISIVEDIVPFIEATYRVDARPRSRAIAGLSMGGGHTIRTALRYPSTFDYICPLSAVFRAGDEEAMATYTTQFEALKDEGVELYFVACGTSDFLFESSNTLDQLLTDVGIDHEYFVTDGGHTWSNWRKYLNTFAPMLFK